MPIREATILRIGTKANPGQKDDSAWAYVRTNDSQTPGWQGPIGKNLTEGSWLRAEGNVKEHTDGRPDVFVVTQVLILRLAKPNLGKSWLEWRLPDIGDKRAEVLSREYEAEALADVMDDPQRAAEALNAVAGLTPARVAKILKAYAERPGELRLTIRMGVFGMLFGHVQKILEHYKEVSIVNATIRRNAYEFLRLDGITFGTCDDFSKKLGRIKLEDPRRTRAFAWSMLVEAAGQSGDCWLSFERLFSMSQQHAMGAKDVFVAGLQVEGAEDFVNLPTGLQLTKLYAAEVFTARAVNNMLDTQREQEELDLIDLPATVLSDESQVAAIRGLIQEPIAVLTGGPGTGKTTVLKTALAQMAKRGERFKLASTSGKAAKRMTQATGYAASTIHRMLGANGEGGFKYGENTKLDADVVVIDEASMLELVIADALFAALRPGCRLLLVGDVNQLPSVGPGQVLTDIIDSKKVPVFWLTKTHRQAQDSWVIDNANRILHGEMPSLERQSDFRFLECKTVDEFAQRIVTAYQDAQQNGNVSQLQVLTPQTGVGEKPKGAGAAQINALVQRDINPHARPTNPNRVPAVGAGNVFKGDKVLYTKNLVDIGLVNGSMGTVLDVFVRKGEQTEVTVRFEGEVNPNGGGEEFVLRGEHTANLLLAYAMTVHKAQGSEWSDVIIVCDEKHSNLRRRLFYTAVTRTSKNLTLLGSKRAIEQGTTPQPPRRHGHDGLPDSRATLLMERIQESINY